MRVIGESHSDLMKRYPGLYQGASQPIAPKPKKESFSRKWDKFMVRYQGAFGKAGVEDAMRRLGADAPVHFYAGKINRVSLAPGDIFIQYNSSRKHNPHKLPQLLTGNFKFSNFTHGGLIVSNTELIHAGAPDAEDVTNETPLHKHYIDDIFNAKREYRIFRPRNRELASKMVELAVDLCDNRYIPFAGIVMPSKEDLKKGIKGITDFLKEARACKGDRAIFRFSRKARQIKDCEQLSKEYNDMIGVDYEVLDQYARQLEIDMFNDLAAKGIDIYALDPNDMDYLRARHHEQVETFKVENYASTKRFLCTQFVAWVIQLSTVVLHEMNPIRFPLDIANVLPIRDTKAIPARLARLLTKSPHFIEFKSEESYGVPLVDPVPISGVALGLVGEIGDPDFSPPLQSVPAGKTLDDIFNEPMPAGLQAPIVGVPRVPPPIPTGTSILDQHIPAGLQAPLIPMVLGGIPPVKKKRQAPLPPPRVGPKRQAPLPPPFIV